MIWLPRGVGPVLLGFSLRASWYLPSPSPSFALHLGLVGAYKEAEGLNLPLLSESQLSLGAETHRPDHINP